MDEYPQKHFSNALRRGGYLFIFDDF